MLDCVQAAQQTAQIMTGAAVDGVEVKKAGQMVVFKFLPRVEQRRALEKIEHRRVVHERALVAHEGRDARLVVVFQKAELVVVRGVAGLLKIQRVQIAAQGDLAAQIPVEYLAHVVLVFQIEGTKHLAVRRGIDAVPPRETAIAAVDRFGEPYAVRVYISDRRAGLQPEFHGDERRHIAAEAVHQFSPHYKRIRQILPKPAVGVVQVDDVGPVAELVARLAVGVVVEVFRMLAVENRVGRGVVVDHVDHAFHAVRVDLAHQRFKVLHRTVGRVDGAVITVGIGAAQRAFLALDADGVNGHQPDDIRPQRADAVEVGNDGAEGALRRVVADVNGIDHLILQSRIGVCSHVALPPQCFMPRL